MRGLFADFNLISQSERDTTINQQTCWSHKDKSEHGRRYSVTQVPHSASQVQNFNKKHHPSQCPQSRLFSRILAYLFPYLYLNEWIGNCSKYRIPVKDASPSYHQVWSGAFQKPFWSSSSIPTGSQKRLIDMRPCGQIWARLSQSQS